MEQNFDINQINNECSFSFTRSSGPGGQNVNKVNTKVELRFNLYQSAALSDEQKQLLTVRLSHRLTSSGEIVLTCQENRSQLKNKNLALNKLIEMLSNCLVVHPKRVQTKRTKSSIRKRLEQKKRLGEKKQLRKRLK